jgi:hypothetical protein
MAAGIRLKVMQTIGFVRSRCTLHTFGDRNCLPIEIIVQWYIDTIYSSGRAACGLAQQKCPVLVCAGGPEDWREVEAGI